MQAQELLDSFDFDNDALADDEIETIPCVQGHPVIDDRQNDLATHGNAARQRALCTFRAASTTLRASASTLAVGSWRPWRPWRSKSAPDTGKDSPDYAGMNFRAMPLSQ
jgi:hypothetical protein